MKILVTGAAGFLGVSLVERLLSHGERDIRCLVRSAGNLDRLEKLREQYPEAALELVRGTLNARDDVMTALDGVETVYHLAAAMKGGAADMILNTVVASKILLEAAAPRKPMRIVLVSSFAVYGVSGLPRGTRVDESTPLEPHPAKRDPYSFAKLRQEQLFREFQAQHGFELVIIRPGVIYGPGGPPFSSRVGVNLFGLFLHMGGGNRLPLTYVDNCAEAIAVLGRLPDASGQLYNVHDDDLPTSRQYLRAYKKQVRGIPSLPVPYPAILLLSRMVEKYHAASKGQLPLIFTRYKSAALWSGNCFTNEKLKKAGWRQIVPTEQGLQRTFQSLRQDLNSGAGA